MIIITEAAADTNDCQVCGPDIDMTKRPMVQRPEGLMWVRFDRDRDRMVGGPNVRLCPRHLLEAGLALIASYHRHFVAGRAEPLKLPASAADDLDVCECEHTRDEHEEDDGKCLHDGAFARTTCSCIRFKKAQV